MGGTARGTSRHARACRKASRETPLRGPRTQTAAAPARPVRIPFQRWLRASARASFRDHNQQRAKHDNTKSSTRGHMPAPRLVGKCANLIVRLCLLHLGPLPQRYARDVLCLRAG
eukprot:2460974-Alexandrium_andersonii.AAC.1